MPDADEIHALMTRVLTKGAGTRVDPARQPPCDTDVPIWAHSRHGHGRCKMYM